MANYATYPVGLGTQSATGVQPNSGATLMRDDDVLRSANAVPTRSVIATDDASAKIEEALQKYGAATHKVVTKRYAIK